ncbi:MAG: hypothetical protein CPSOU_2530 [uncultured Paraburkholderia sp.]|nr:MAG: hypothetical protein CPSOU_2530 [uncultured Paraburkholderia sp.]
MNCMKRYAPMAIRRRGWPRPHEVCIRRMLRRDARTTVREEAAARRPRGSRTTPWTAAHGARPVSSIDTASARRPLKPDASLDP